MHAPYPPPMTLFRVWDIPTRAYHWLQAGLVTAALATGYLAPAWWLDVHVWVGYGLIALIVFRLVWAGLGSHYSRLSSLPLGPRALMAHLRGLAAGRAAHAVGHTPLGSLMVLTLIATIAAICLTGLLVLGGVENQGPLAAFTAYSTGSLARRAHTLLSAGLLALIGLHLLGVFGESWLGREPLVRSMLTGKKPVAADRIPPDLARPRRLAGSLVTAVIVFAAAMIGAYASRLPASGLIAMPAFKTYTNQCSDCHEPYHPSLLPRASWAGIMAHLNNHFGEDASLDPATTAKIAAYLQKYASEAWDTKAANRLRIVDPAHPGRITDSPGWIRIHHRIDPAVFKSKAVRVRSNCKACHRDALSGRFDNQMIAIPGS